ncbi:MAG: hypothetical protein HQL06_17565 [Nitrospirae bacterium]|nr:hypothetical protein [Nitrospirota bacterium]
MFKAIGNFDGDGKTDILWQNSSLGDVYVWFMSGFNITGGVYTWFKDGLNTADKKYVVNGMPSDWMAK